MTMLNRQRNGARSSTKKPHAILSTTVDAKPSRITKPHKPFTKTRIETKQCRGGATAKTKPRDYLKRSPQHPLLERFIDTTDQYEETVVNSGYDRLDTVFEELMSRLGVNPMEEHLQAIEENICYVKEPLSNVLIEARFKNSDKIEHLPLGTTFSRFEQMVATTKQELDALWEQWSGVQRQIEDVSRDLLSNPSAANGKARSASDTLDDAIRRLESEIAQNTKQSLEEVDKEARVEADKRRIRQEKWDELFAVDE